MTSAFVRVWFEEGSLGLEGSLGSGLGFARWDARARCFRAPAHRYAEVLDVAARLGLELDDQIAPLLREPAPSGRWRLPSPGHLAQDALHAFDTFGGRASIVARAWPERARIAFDAIASSQVRALLLCPSREDAARWTMAARRWLDGPIALGSAEARAPLRIASFDEAWSATSLLGGHHGLLVVDAAEQLVASPLHPLLERYAAPERLGLCARRPPACSQDEARLASLLGPIACERVTSESARGAPLRATRITLPLDGFERQELDRALRPLAALEASSAHLLPSLSTSPEGKAAIASYRRALSLACLSSSKRSVARELLARHHSERIALLAPLPSSGFAPSAENLVSLLASDLPRGERWPLLDAMARGSIVALPSIEALSSCQASVVIILGGSSPERPLLPALAAVIAPAMLARMSLYELVSYASPEDGRWGLDAAGPSARGG